MHRWAVLGCLIATSALAAPMRVDHSVRVLDADGDPMEGALSITVRLYNDSELSHPVDNLLFSDLFGVTAEQGYANLELGSGVELQTSVFDAPEVWLETQVGTDPPLLPRTRLSGVPYAARATTAEVADRADAIRLISGEPSATCGDGEFGYFLDDEALRVCVGDAWIDVGNQTISSTGGNITELAGFRTHTFLSSDTFTVDSQVTAEVLIVGGGGAGGGRHGGGGGGGGVVHIPLATIDAGTYPVVVGAGGATNTGCTNSGGANGVSSTVFGETAVGGGGGGSYSQIHGAAGGSGGGAGHSNTNGGASNQGALVALTGTVYGNAGAHNPSGGNEASGGGGAGAAGQVASANAYGGYGGAGVQIDIDGNNYYYGGGGGGGLWSNSGSPAGSGGLGGGGGGGVGHLGTAGAGGGSARNSGAAGVLGSTNNAHGGAGGANTGGGGGGSGQCGHSTWTVGHGGAGGSGIVIVKLQL